MTAKEIPAVATQGCFVEGASSPEMSWTDKERRNARSLQMRREDFDGYVYSWDNSFHEIESHSMHTPRSAKRYFYLLNMQSRGQSMLKARPVVIEAVPRELPDTPTFTAAVPEKDGSGTTLRVIVHPQHFGLVKEWAAKFRLDAEATHSDHDALASKVRALEGATERDVEDAMTAVWLRHRKSIDGDEHAYTDMYRQLTDLPTDAVSSNDDIEQLKVGNIVEQLNTKFALNFAFASADEDNDLLP